MMQDDSKIFSEIASTAKVHLLLAAGDILTHASPAAWTDYAQGVHREQIKRAVKDAREALNKIEGMLESLSETENADDR